MYLYQRVDGDGSIITRNDGKVWLLASPPGDSEPGGIVLEVDLNVPDRDLSAFRQSHTLATQAYLVPPRWIARHATVHRC